MQNLLAKVEHEGVHCGLVIERPAPAIALIVLRGTDTGEFGDFPMRELAKDLARFPQIELFIDARAVRSASINVSGEWALWMRTHRTRFSHINMLAASRYIQITAGFVQRFAGLLDRMKLFTEPGAFDEALRASIRLASAA